ncbi:MAG: RNA degradosome polyphosphate kinase [Candidatus Ornithomonoglobus sp.]
MEINYSAPENFINRELSWLDFNFRILNEARDKNHPLFERIKFLAITSSNLDEFYMVRVASLRNITSVQKRDASGLTAKEQLKAISKKTHKLVDMQYSTYARSLLPLLAKERVKIVKFDELDEKQRKYITEYFHSDIFPILTPMAVDSSRPFPLIQNKALNICALVKNTKTKQKGFVTVPVPGICPRVIRVPSNGGSVKFILIEDIIKEFLGELFTSYTIINSGVYRVMRDADIPLDEDDSEDLLEEIQKNLKQRERSQVIRLEVEDIIVEDLLKILTDELKVKNDDVYLIKGPVDLTFLNKIYGQEGFDEYKYKPFTPQIQKRIKECDNIFDEIKKGDIFFHHPYDSFRPIVQLIETAADDEATLAIKMTLYRVSGNSPIIKALARAAQNGKAVTVLVELKARFDESNNIVWARKLEKAGCHVIYGLLGLKTHSKITEIIRREESGIIKYVHLATGNYNDVTANFYTDMGIFTCRKEYGDDSGAFFNMLSGFCEPKKWNKLIVAPIWLRDRTQSFIEREIRNAEAGKKAHIIAKMNSLVDPQIISLLYKASCAGVKIDLIVRGICCLRAQVPGLSENITVRSITGRYLEHTRIYYFYNDGDENIFCASADWMNRNLDKRVEIMFPIEDELIREKIMHVLNVQLEDTLRASVQVDGEYSKIDLRGKTKSDCQIVMMEEAVDACKPDDEISGKRAFIPRERPEED